MRDSSVGWLATTNRVAGIALAVLGLVIVGIGFYLGVFAWMNDGAAAGLELMLVTAGFGLAPVVTGFSFIVIARAHARRSSRRWWLQVLLPVATAFIAFGLAAEFSSLAGNLVR